MTIPQFGNMESLILPLLYLSSGYISLMLAYRLSGDLELFFKEIKGTDKIILTFLVGAFSVLLSTSFPGVPSQVSQNSVLDMAPALGSVVAINTLSITLVREIEKN